jgi:aspartate aminotransferase
VSLPSLARIPAPPDAILGLAEAFRNDTREGKINLSSGVFVDETGTTPVLATVIEAERRLAAAAGTKLYRPIDGEVAYRNAVRDLALGAGHEAVTSGRALATQTPGGTGGLRVAADLLRQTGAGVTLWMSEPTWPNHPQLFTAAGFRIRPYPYTDETGRRIDEAAMLDALGDASPGDIVLLHGACHNPTGVDPSPELWRRIGDLLQERRLLPLVDLAYQGFGDGLLEDATGLLELVRPGMELLVSTSFSKTFSLYAERVGAMIVIARSAADAAAVQSHVKMAIRVNYSNPPAHGADIVRTILLDPELRARWEVELAGMRNRIKDNRRALVAALEARAIPGDWGGIASQRGMFALLGLTAHQVARLKDEHGVYVVGRGRINVAGFTSRNLDPFADALATVIASS